MGRLEFQNVCKTYGEGTHAVRDLCLGVSDGEFLVLVGPSGCGKTTALRMVAGLETISSGHIRLDEEAINDVEPRDRDIAMVFQNYALYPNLSVEGNLGFALKMRGMSRAAIRERVGAVARSLDLETLLDRRPAELSGGQRQRVAMGRAIVREPSAFLMDEPLSNLDAALRLQLRAEIGELQRRLSVTTIYVTHDQVEAMTMGDRIAVMSGGELQQHGTPTEVYDRPANLFVASFIGSPPMNLFEAHVVVGDGTVALRFGDSSWAIPASADLCAALRATTGQDVVVGVRPESLRIGDDGAADSSSAIRARISHCEMLGAEEVIHLDAGVRAPALVAPAPAGDPAPPAGGKADSARFIVRCPRTGRHRVGDMTWISADAKDLHFFRKDDGASLVPRRSGRADLPEIVGAN